MIKSFTIENFFSFAGKTEIPVNPGVNVLVGINASGKTNFLRALRLQEEFWFGYGKLDELLNREWGGADKVTNFSLQRKGGFKLEFINEEDEKYFLIVDVGGYGVFYVKAGIDFASKAPMIRFENGKTIVFDKENKKARYVVNTSPGGLFIAALENHEDGNSLVEHQNSLVCYEQFDVTRYGPIRRLGEYNSLHRLRSDGSNLVTLLNRLKNHHTIAYDKLVESLTEVSPNFKDISFEIIGSNYLLSLRERNLDRSVTIEHISDGTLRYLLLLAILLNPERGATICLDEPEIGLHPDMIAGIARLIKQAASEGTQIFVATHSPMLLNAFELEDIIIFEKDKDNKTIIKRPSSEDFEEDESRLPGFLWLSGRIGGKRW